MVNRFNYVSLNNETQVQIPHPWLLQSNLIKTDAITLFHPRVRDRDDVKVLRCQKSNIIFLDRVDHIRSNHYIEKPLVSSVPGCLDTDQPPRSQKHNPDLKRRQKWITPYIKNKTWLDFGCGRGEILKKARHLATETMGVELNAIQRQYCLDQKLRVWQDLTEIPECSVDVVSMFHVLEHLVDPQDILKQLVRIMKHHGTLLIEVPHAKDFLLTSSLCPKFRDFSLWSEHLILHTRQSLKSLLQSCGFTLRFIRGVQRYSLSNHIGWIRYGRPNGHLLDHAYNHDPQWAIISKRYAQWLISSDRSDTLIAVATLNKP